MKKLFIFICVLFCALSSHSQNNPNYNYQKLTGSTPKTIVFGSSLQLDSSLIFIYSYPDTLTANYGFIDQIAGATIRVGDSLYQRANCKCQWLLISGASTNIPSLPDGLISVQGISLVDTTVTISPNIVWRRDNINYTQTTSSVFQINKADSGYSRFDLIYIDSLNVIRLIEGVQDTVVVVPPAMPPHGIQVTIVSIIGDVVLTPTPSVSTNYWSPNGNNISSGTAYLGTLNSKTLDFIIAGLIRASLDTIGQMRFYLVNNGNYPHALTFYNNLDATLPSFNLAVNSSYGEISLSANNTGYLNALRIKKANGTDSIVGGAYSDMILQDYGKLKYNTTSSQTSAFEVIQGTTTPLFTVNSTTKPGVYIGSDTTYKPSSALTIPSTTQGILPPRMSTAQMNAINLPSNGLFLYNTDDSAYYYYKVNAWVKIATGSSSGGSSDTLFVVPPLYAFGANLDSLRGSWADTDSSGFLRSSDWNYFAVKPDSTVLNATGDTLLSYLGSTVIYSKAIAGGSSGWSLTGNAGTDPTINFLGTTDAQPLYLRVNNDTIAKFGTNNNISFGSSVATNFYSYGLGRANNVTAAQGIGLGSFNEVSTSKSIGIGGSNVLVVGGSAIGIGNDNINYGGNSVSAGYRLVNKQLGGIVVGLYNDSSDTRDPDPSIFSPTDRIFQIGNGDPTILSRSNAMTILRNGNVGIGTTTPAAKLQIASADSNVLNLSGLINTPLSTDSALVIGTDGNVKKAAKSSGGSLDSSNLLTTTATRTATGSITFTNLINTTPKVHYWGLNGQSNAENQAVAGDSLYPYKKNWTPNVQIQVNPSGDGVTWVTANRYTNNIAGGSIVRENSAVVAAQEYLVSHPYDTIKLTTVISSGKALSYWTKDLTGFGEKDSVSTGWYIANTKYSALPAASLEVIFWQQGEQNQTDTTVNAWTYMMKRLDSAYKTLPGVSPNLKMIFSYPTTTYSQVRAMLDSIDNGLIDMSGKNWTVVKHPFTTGVDAIHLNNYQQWRVGRMFNTAFQFSSSNPVESPIITRPGQNLADSTVTFKPAPTSKSLANITLGTTTRFTNRPIEFTQNVLANSLVTLSGPGAVLRVITTSTSGGQSKVSTTSATTGVYSSFQLCQGLSSSYLLAEARGTIAAAGGHFDIATSVNGSTLVPKFRVDSAGNTLIAPTVVGLLANSTLQVSGSFAPAYVAKTANYTLTKSDHTVECTANTFTVTLPTAVGCVGREYFITNSGAGTITINTTSSEVFVNVSGTPTTLTLAPFASYFIYSNNAAWLAK